MSGISNHGIYSDLMRRFRDEGHSVFIVHPHERSLGKKTELYEADGAHILGVKTLNLQKTSVIEKGIGQVLVEPLFKAAITPTEGQEQHITAPSIPYIPRGK